MDKLTVVTAVPAVSPHIQYRICLSHLATCFHETSLTGIIMQRCDLFLCAKYRRWALSEEEDRDLFIGEEPLRSWLDSLKWADEQVQQWFMLWHKRKSGHVSPKNIGFFLQHFCIINIGSCLYWYSQRILLTLLYRRSLQPAVFLGGLWCIFFHTPLLALSPSFLFIIAVAWQKRKMYLQVKDEFDSERMWMKYTEKLRKCRLTQLIENCS